MRRALAGLAVLVTLAVARPLSAQVIFNGGAPNQLNGNEMTEWIQYNDFALLSTKTVTEIDFWSVVNPAAPGYNGSISWFITTDNAGVPGTTLFSGNEAATVTATGLLAVNDQLTEYFNQLAVNFTLGAGTYWLGLHNGPLTNDARSEYYWETTSAGFGGTGQEDDTPFGDNLYFDNGADHAFQLLGTDVNPVPEPATMSLLGLGLAALATQRRRRRA